MDPALPLLIKLAKLDEARLDIRRQVERIDRRLGNAKKAVEDSQQALDDATGAVSTNRKTEASLQGQLATFQSQLDAARRAIDAGLGTDAASRQVERSQELTDEAETDILELLELRDDLETHVVAAREELERNTRTRDGIDADLRTERKELAARWKELGGHRTPLIADLPLLERSSYEQLMVRKHAALATIVDEACSACHKVVPFAMRTELKEGRAITCRGCHRWLYYGDVG